MNATNTHSPASNEESTIEEAILKLIPRINQIREPGFSNDVCMNHCCSGTTIEATNSKFAYYIEYHTSDCEDETKTEATRYSLKSWKKSDKTPNHHTKRVFIKVETAISKFKEILEEAQE